MNFQLTDIEFDFDSDDDFPSSEYRTKVIDDALSLPWIADHEDELVEEISNQTGWCVRSLNYILVED